MGGFKYAGVQHRAFKLYRGARPIHQQQQQLSSLSLQVVVILVLWIISLLVVYMLFLLCLDPLLNKRRSQPSYQEHTNEEEEAAGAIEGAPGMAQPLRVRPNVLGRVGHQQDKWKRQVQEQRRNIYDRHTMLN